MSQEDILNILKELGGKATTKEIKDRARAKYPNRTLYNITSTRLRQLKGWDIVGRDKEIWYIK